MLLELLKLLEKHWHEACWRSTETFTIPKPHNGQGLDLEALRKGSVGLSFNPRLWRRFPGFPVHPSGDVHVHDQAAAVFLAGHHAGEAPLRHPLPGGSAQRLSRSRERLGGDSVTLPGGTQPAPPVGSAGG